MSRLHFLLQIFNCSQCSKSFARDWYLQLHLKSHRNKMLDDQVVPSVQCYVCGKGFPTLKGLNSHMSEHSIYQQWVDPANIHLSNWSREEAQEILRNQPLVLVENLDVERINLKSLADFIQRNKNGTVELRNSSANQNTESMERYEHETKNSFDQEDLSPIHAEWNMKEQNDLKDDGILPADTHTDEQNLTVFNAYRDLSPIYSLYHKDDDVPFDQTPADEDAEKGEQNATKECRNYSPIHSIDDIEDDANVVSSKLLMGSLPNSVQLIDSTVINDEEDSVTGDIIDISSESDDDDDVEIIFDISQIFYCDFCDETFHSLKDLGLHNKLCSLSDI